MTLPATLLLAAFVALILLWLVGTAIALRKGASQLPQTAAALLFPVSLLLALVGGWWSDLSRYVVLGASLTALTWLATAYIHRQTGSQLAAATANASRFVQTGFFLVLGILCLRNGGPLTPEQAWTAIALSALTATTKSPSP